jgi:hypothetical protein
MTVKRRNKIAGKIREKFGCRDAELITFIRELIVVEFSKNIT